MERVSFTLGWPFFARAGAKKTEGINQVMDAAAGRDQLEGLFLGPAYLRCDDGGTIKIGPIARGLLGNANARFQTTAETVYTPLDPVLGTAGRYHLFVRNNAGTPEFYHVASVTASPDPSLTFRMSGLGVVDETSRYIGTFCTSKASSAIRKFRARRGRYIYQVSGMAASELIEVAGSNATTYQGMSLGGYLPAHADQVILRASLYSVGAACNATFKTNSADTGEDEMLSVRGAADVNSREFEMIVSDLSTIQYKVNHADGQLLIAVKGFQE
jgi:hypothetical protein